MFSGVAKSIIIFCQMLRRIVINDIKKNIGKITMIIKLFVPVLIVYYHLNYFSALILFCAVMFISWSIMEVNRIYNRKTRNDIPIPSKVMTEVDEGLITIKNEYMQEAILYLHSVEEYLKSKGYL